MGLRLVAAVSLSMLLGLLPADEPTDDQLKTEMRALHAQLSRANDIWSCLQAEAYTEQALKLRLNHVLGNARIYGDARFAFPHDIRNVWDCGPTINVISGQRFYRIAPDGRPLQGSVALPFHPGRNWLSQDGTRIVIANAEGAYNARKFSVAAVATADGAVTLNRTESLPPAPIDVLDNVGSPVCSYDGKTIAVVIFRYSSDPVAHRLKILVGDTPVVSQNDAESIGAVGNNGTWVIYEKFSQRNRWFLKDKTGETEVPRSGFARGPGLYCLETVNDKTLELLDADGARTVFDPAVALGVQAEVHTVGRYLVVCSGQDATSKPTTDILGNPIGGGEPQPFSLCIYRWTDLVADRKAAPVMTVANTFVTSDHHAPGLMLWQGKNLEHLDLGGDEPLRTQVAELPWPIGAVDVPRYFYLIRSQDAAERVLLRADGKEIWRGPNANRIDVQTRRHLVIRENGEGNSPQRVVTPHVDPAQRRTITLEMPVSPGWWLTCDEDTGRIVARHGEGHWRSFDPATGKVVESFEFNPMRPTRRPPGTDRTSCPDGRWYDLNGRLLTKDGSWDDDPLRSLIPKNIFKGSSTTLILDNRGPLFHCRQPDDLKFLADIDADDFGTIKGSNAFFLTDRHEVVAEITRGPKVDTETSALGKRAQDLDQGRWYEQQRGQTWSFSPPGLGRQVWSEDLAGFTPRSCRSFTGTGLFILTASIILEIDVAVARRVAVKDT